MNLTRTLNHKVNASKMIAAGIGGIFINEISGAISGEPKTTHELNQLPKGYIIKGLGHLFGNRSLINNSRDLIRDYHSKQKIKKGIFNYQNA